MPDKIGIVVEGGGKTEKGVPATRENSWDEIVDRFKEFGVKITKFDTIGPAKLKDVQKYDVIIIKWDAANGDHNFGSDDIANQLEHNKPDLKEFIKNGGVLIVECQSNNWLPSQKTYDVILNSLGSIKVYDDQPSSTGFYVRRVGLPHTSIFKQDYSVNDDHPILKNLSEKIYPLPNLNKKQEPWFKPLDSVSSDVLCKTYPNKVYVGWFTSFSREWRPLLYDEDHEHAVMIWRPFGKGAVIASTMFLASSFIPQLLRNVFPENENFGLEMRNYVKSIDESLGSRRSQMITGIIIGVVEIILSGYIFGEITKYMSVGLGIIFVTVFVEYEMSKKII